MTETSKRTQGDRVPAKLSQDLRALGADLYSTCTGFKYARNGNVHNPTPELLYVGTYQGQVVTRQRTARAAKETLAAHISKGK